jgi:hypothetical protein
MLEGRSSAFLNLRSTETQAKGTSQIFTTLWYCAHRTAFCSQLHVEQGSNESRGFYQTFLDLLRTSYEESKVKGWLFPILTSSDHETLFLKDGKFGAMMSVKLCNEVLLFFSNWFSLPNSILQLGSSHSEP